MGFPVVSHVGLLPGLSGWYAWARPFRPGLRSDNLAFDTTLIGASQNTEVSLLAPERIPRIRYLPVLHAPV